MLKPGTHSSIQDFPGRTGYWAVGVPPSGPMDALAFRLANRIVGNPSGAAGIELTVTGPTLRFNAAATIALAGAQMEATLDGEPAPYWAPWMSARAACWTSRLFAGLPGAGLRLRSRRIRRARLPGQQIHLRAGQVRRARRPDAAHGDVLRIERRALRLGARST